MVDKGQYQSSNRHIKTQGHTDLIQQIDKKTEIDTKIAEAKEPLQSGFTITIRLNAGIFHATVDAAKKKKETHYTCIPTSWSIKRNGAPAKDTDGQPDKLTVIYNNPTSSSQKRNKSESTL